MGYVLICDQCGGDEVSYVGETGQNVNTRRLRHVTNYKGRHPDSPDMNRWFMGGTVQ